MPAYILPAPAAVWNALWSGSGGQPGEPARVLPAALGNPQERCDGLVIGSTLGLVLGSLMAESRLIEKLIMPYAFALQSLPKVAIAPLIVIWFGFGDGSKIAIAALLSFFPLLINCFTGLRAVEPERIDLMRSLSASRFETYRIVKLPNAAPYIFAGLDMAVVYALLGTIVAEFLGAQQGHGRRHHAGPGRHRRRRRFRRARHSGSDGNFAARHRARAGSYGSCIGATAAASDRNSTQTSREKDT